MSRRPASPSGLSVATSPTSPGSGPSATQAASAAGRADGRRARQVARLPPPVMIKVRLAPVAYLVVFLDRQPAGELRHREANLLVREMPVLRPAPLERVPGVIAWSHHRATIHHDDARRQCLITACAAASPGCTAAGGVSGDGTADCRLHGCCLDWVGDVRPRGEAATGGEGACRLLYWWRSDVRRTPRGLGAISTRRRQRIPPAGRIESRSAIRGSRPRSGSMTGRHLC